MYRVFYHSVIHGLDFFIYFMKQQSTEMSEINKLTQFNTTKAPRASSLKLPAASQKAPSQISSKKMFFTISYKNDDWR